MTVEIVVKHGNNCIGSLSNIECFIHKVCDLLGNVFYYDVNYHYPRILVNESYLAWYGLTTYPEHSTFSGDKEVYWAGLKWVTGIVHLQLDLRLECK